MTTDNSAALKAGMTKAKAFITSDLTGRLNRLMGDMVSDMYAKMKEDVPGMTGNTQTSPAGAVYVNGVLESIDLGDGRKPPLQGKLRAGQVFSAGRVRYDGDIQKKTFKADVDTTGNMSQSDNYAFLESQQSGTNELKMTVVGGTEYLGQQQVADNYAKCEDEIPKYFKS